MHQADGAFLHARAARRRNDDERNLLLQRPFDGARDHLAHHGPHAAADKLQLHRADVDAPAVQVSGGRNDGVAQVRGFLRSGQTILVFLRIDEIQRIGGHQALIEFFELSIVEQQGQTRARVQPLMMAALGANLVIVL